MEKRKGVCICLPVGLCRCVYMWSGLHLNAFYFSTKLQYLQAFFLQISVLLFFFFIIRTNDVKKNEQYVKVANDFLLLSALNVKSNVVHNLF